MLDEEVKDLLVRVAALEETCSPLHLRLTPLQGLIVLTGMQLAYLNPAATAAARAVLEQVGRRIQDSLASYDPIVGQVTEQGWHRED